VVHDPAAVRQRIGLVFQDPSLDDQLTGRENLEFHAFVYSVPAQDRRRRIDEMLDLLQLADRASSQVKTYSGGMKRRLEIARGMLHQPQILFLDEPTLGLDPQTRKSIWTHLNELRSTKGVTIFMTTHYMDEAEYCDRIAIIDRGKIVALGTPEELKGLVGGDVVTITSTKPDAAESEIKKLLGVTPVRDNGSLRMEVPDGKAFVPRLVRELEKKGEVPVADVAASFQKAITEMLAEKTARAAAEHAVETVLLGGGVAANLALREAIARRIGHPLRVPRPGLCTDNGAMIGAAAFFVLRHRGTEIPVAARSDLKLA